MTPNLIRQYLKLTEFLGRTLGPDYEVVLHDLEDKNSIVAIANGHVSGRGLDSRLASPLLTQLESDRSYETRDYKVNYGGVAVGRKILRTSSFYIKDEQGRLVGLLCINFDDQRFQKISNQILKLCHPDSFVDNNFIYNAEKAEMENVPVTGEAEGVPEAAGLFQDNNPEAAGEMICQLLKECGLGSAPLSRRERIAAVERLQERGVFLLKGAVKQAARHLNCSQATIYRYLERVRQDMEPTEDR